MAEIQLNVGLGASGRTYSTSSSETLKRVTLMNKEDEVGLISIGPDFVAIHRPTRISFAEADNCTIRTDYRPSKKDWRLPLEATVTTIKPKNKQRPMRITLEAHATDAVENEFTF